MSVYLIFEFIFNFCLLIFELLKGHMRKSILPSCFAILLLIGCGKAPSPLPPVETGSIRISVQEAAPGDSILPVLDDRDMGKHPNPFLLAQVAVGLHKLSVFMGDIATPPQFVEVRRGETTPVTFNIATGPYVGHKAPLFAVQDVKGDSITLSKERGKVVLLIFFEHT
jgi:hypothetical protein